MEKNLGKWILMVLFAILGGIIGFIILGHVNNALKDGENIFEIFFIIAVIAACAYLAFIFQIIVHELGHLIFGLISGYKFASFRIFSFMFVKKNGKIKLKRFSLAGTGGQCLMSPPDLNNGDFPLMLYNFGGSIANLFVSILALILFLKDIPYISSFLILTIIIGVIFALFNGIPMHLGYMDNDGYNALYLNKNKASKKYFWIQLKMNGLITDEVRLKDMPSEWFHVPKEDLNNSMCSSIGVFACLRAIDEMNFEKAKEIGYELLKNASGIVGIHRYLLTSEMIFCELIGENKKEKVEKLYTNEFKKFIRILKNNPSIIRMEYAYELLLNHNEEAARKLLNIFNNLAKTYPHQCEIQGEKELIDYVYNIYKSKNEVQ